MSMVKVEIPVLCGAGVACWSYPRITRDRNLANLEPREDRRRYFSFTLWLVARTFSIHAIGSFFADGDGVWQ